MVNTKIERASHGFNAIVPDTAEYQKDTFRDGNGRLHQNVTLISRATKYGGSRIFDPNKPTIINVDPNVPGMQAVVDIAKLDKDTVNQLAAKCQSLSPTERASLIFRRASMGDKPIERLPSQAVEPAKPVVIEEPKVAALNTEVETLLQTIDAAEPKANVTSAAPSTLFPPIAKMATKVARVVENNISKSVPSGNVPTNRVTFELPEFGCFEAAYHRVVKDGDFLILIYDNSWTFGLKYMPRGSEQPIIVDVHDHNQAYQVISLGINFTVDGNDYCVLGIERTADKENV